VIEFTANAVESRDFLRATEIEMAQFKKLISCFLLAGCLVCPNIVQTHYFYGDTTLRSYLTILCSQLHSHSKVQLALVVKDNRSRDNSSLARHMSQLSCGHLY